MDLAVCTWILTMKSNRPPGQSCQPPSTMMMFLSFVTLLLASPVLLVLASAATSMLSPAPSTDKSVGSSRKEEYQELSSRSSHCCQTCTCVCISCHWLDLSAQRFQILSTLIIIVQFAPWCCSECVSVVTARSWYWTVSPDVSHWLVSPHVGTRRGRGMSLVAKPTTYFSL